MSDLLRVTDLHYSTLHGGMVDGFPAVVIELGGGRTVSVSALCASISVYVKSCVVNIRGDAHDNTNDALYALCSSLKEQGYYVSAHLRGNEKRGWVEALSYKVAFITEEPWLMFATNEVRYGPTHGGEISEPYLAPIHFTSYCYLVPHRDNTGEEIFDFLAKHPGFRVFSNKTYRKSIGIKEET
jgi:hypothetical protein